MRKILAIITVLLTAVTTAVYAQYPPPGQMQMNEFIPTQGSVDLDEDGNPILPPEDSTKKVKIRKPLESYFFDDSIKKDKYFSWRTSLSANRIEMIPIDTMPHSVQPHHPFTTPNIAWQGSLGSAVFPLNYTERPQYRDFTFAQGFDAYNIFPEEALFYNVKTPLTFFSYYMSGQSKRFEEGFYLTHAQNISPSSGFNIDYRSQGGRGHYNWSKARDKNLSMAFSHTGRRYTAHAGYIYNTANNKENGGVVNDRYITDTIYELAEAVPVRLTDARNVLKGNTFYIVQSYGIPLRKLADSTTMSDYSSVFVGHSAEWGRWTKRYTDSHNASRYSQIYSGKPGEVPKDDPPGNWTLNKEPDEFYSDWFLDPLATFDSISETRLSNRAFIQIQPYDRDGVVGLIDGGVGVDVHRYYMFHPREYISGRRVIEKQTDYYVYGSISGSVSRYLDWSGNARYHPVGDERRGDFEIGAQAAMRAFVRGRPITLSGRFVTMQNAPSYWDENLISNHFIWFNDFNKESETRLTVQLHVPSWDLEVGATQSVIMDKIYYDATARPAQDGGTISVSGAYIDKQFNLGGWQLRHRILVQESSNQGVIPVPLATVYLSYSFGFTVVKNALHARIGLDGYYNTSYYAPGWMPATARFYNQREKKLGDYPYVDFFVAAKWKRMRILLKMEHLNEGFIENRNYFTLLHYPLQKRAFKLGMTWTFYD